MTDKTAEELEYERYRGVLFPSTRVDPRNSDDEEYEEYERYKPYLFGAQPTSHPSDDGAA